MSDIEKLIGALRGELDHANRNGHVLSPDCQGVAWGEKVPAVRAGYIEAVIGRFENTHAPTESNKTPNGAEGLAITPTDDEQEALGRILESWAGPWMDGQRPALYDLLVAAGFRRSEVPEPSAEPKHDESCTEWCKHCQVCGEGIRYGSRCPEHYQNQTQGEPSDAPKRLVHEVNMILSSVASHGPAALTDTSDRMYTTGLLRRLRDALDPKPAHRLAAGNAVRAEMARNGLDVHRMVYGQEIANVLAGAALDAALRAAGEVGR